MVEVIAGRFGMRISAAQFSLSTDSMALADFARPKKGARVCDLGCGCGALGLLLLVRDDSLFVTGVEIQPEASLLAAQNALDNGLSQMTVLNRDLREYRDFLPANGFDAVLSNPPYYPVSSGAVCETQSLAIARSEVCCDLSDLCRAASWSLRFGGSFFLVHKPERLADVFVSLRENGLEPKRLQLVRHRPSSKPSLVLIEARLGAKPGLTFERDLLLYTETGEKTPDYLRIYHEG